MLVVVSYTKLQSCSQSPEKVNDIFDRCLFFFLVRFLQGPGTDQSTVQKIRDAINTCNDITVQLLNYTKTGNTFFIACLCAKTSIPRFYLESLR